MSSAELTFVKQILKDPAGDLRFRTGFVAKAKPNQAPNIRHAKIPKNSGPFSKMFRL